jgi:Ca2+-transporting ATPase
MGARGTDVAREAASLVLLDDNFTSIVRAVRLGRRIFDNLHKSMSYLLAVHVPIAGMALLPVLLGWPPLLYPVHIALLELLIDPACSLAFENEPEEADLMQRPPRDVAAPLFSASALAWALLQGAGALALILGGTAWARGAMSEPAARGFAFAVLLVANVMLIVSNRSQSRDVLGALAVRNPMQWVVAGSALAVIVVTLYWPWAAGGMHFAPLPARDLAIALGLGLASGLWFDGVRRLRGR